MKAAEKSWAYNRGTGASVLTARELQTWKQRLVKFQQAVRADKAPTQGTLFAIAESPTAHTIDPFTLPQRNTEFWRGQVTDVGNAALYFVVDHTGPLVLYVGETIKANQRWQGTHDCKRYILSYLSAHRAHGLPVQVTIGFWPYAAENRKARQALESELIQTWRSPFNKENWRRWATPFIGPATAPGQ